METISIEINQEQGFLLAHNMELQFAAIFGGMIVMFLFEGLLPRNTASSNQTNRLISNLSLALINHFSIIIYSAFFIVTVSKFQPDSPLLSYFKLSDIPTFCIFFLLMEFVNYAIHRAFHHIPFLWKIHRVHHTDIEVDTTTSHRHHPIEPLLGVIIMTPVIFIIGAPAIIMIIYSLLHTVVSVVSHSNIQLPQKLDNFLRWFIITPDFHRMHHASDQQYTDSNYGGITPWFDYLFKTATRIDFVKISKMEVGLDKFRSSNDNRLDKVLLNPFVTSD